MTAYYLATTHKHQTMKSKEKKLGVTTYIQDEQGNKGDNYYCRITYLRKKFVLKSPTARVLGRRIEEVTLEAIEENDNRIIQNVKKFIDSTHIEFELKHFKQDSVKNLLRSIDLLNYKITAYLLMDELKESHPETTYFISCIAEDEDLIDSYLMSLEELDPGLYLSIGDEIGFIQNEFSDLIQEYLESNDQIYCSLADILVSQELLSFLSEMNDDNIIKRFETIKTSAFPIDFRRTWKITL